MPEQLTKHPEVTLQVLSSAGAQCGQGVAPSILTQCPAARFCKLPGGEICVYGLGEASAMTQVSLAEWRALMPPAAAEPAQVGGWVIGVGATLAGVVVGVAAARWMARR